MTRTRDELAAETAPSVKAPLWTRDYILACCANLMTGLAFYELVPVLPLYLTGQLQVSSGWLGWIMSIYVLAAIISRPWFAHRVDTGDRKKIYITVYIMLALSFSGYAAAATALAFFLTRFIQGLIWGGMTTSGPTMAVGYHPPCPPRGRPGLLRHDNDAGHVPGPRHRPSGIPAVRLLRDYLELPAPVPGRSGHCISHPRSQEPCSGARV